MSRNWAGRLRWALVLGVLVSLSATQTAGATTIFSKTLRAPAKKKRTCETRLAPDARGVVVRRATAADTGLLRARLGARRGDWDLAVFDAATKDLLTASTGFRSREVAEGFVVDGQDVFVQACRRKGRARRASVGVRTIALAPTTEKIKLVRVWIGSQAEGTRLSSAGFDLTEHGGDGFLDVLAHGADDLQRLRKESFNFDVLLEDVVAADAATLRRMRTRQSPGDGTPLEGARAPAMPSGRVTYRHLWDYTSDMKALVEDPANADYVRPITLSRTSLEGRPIEGIEIAQNVNADDGRPVFLQMGVHHAREWPSGESAMEFGFDLLNNRDETELTLGDHTFNVKELLETTRTIVVPIVNVDGFNVSRESATDAQQGLVAADVAYKRKNCRIEDGLIPQPGECAASEPTVGVDPNRNYGMFWGGPGASGALDNETYWGAGPFSEPETQAVRELVTSRQVVALITNHTYSDLVLRPPGLKSQGTTVDEDTEYKPLGDEMAAQNGYASQYGYELYDTTGTTEDWSYNATGGLGFTFEIGKGEGAALTGAGFHPAYPIGVIAEYFGKGPWAGKGNRAAYFIALDWASETANHALIEGRAKPGTELRLTKSFEMFTSPREENDWTPLTFTDSLKSTMRAAGDGTFSWHVNPSTRPIAEKGLEGREATGLPHSAPMDFQTSGAPFPPNAGEDIPGTYEEQEFSIPASEDNGVGILRIEYPVGPAQSDMDLYVFKNVDGNWEQIGSSTSDNSATVPCSLAGRTGDCKFEEAVVGDVGNGDFRLRVSNWASDSTDWVGHMTFEAPASWAGIPAGTVESYTLSCIDSKSGRVTARRQVVVDRGESVNVGDACKKSKR